MSKRYDGGRAGAPCDYTGAVRGLRLTRRRSRVPWIYLVYHARSIRLASARASEPTRAERGLWGPARERVGESEGRS
ncbi:MAG TPA: hypothetical protein VFT39_13485, partial [Vicinamibacterales bacterium]|nr:hypothetical protein [Vicinamibacterales bacterium]